jgi:hypothetical protein
MHLKRLDSLVLTQFFTCCHHARVISAVGFNVPPAGPAVPSVPLPPDGKKARGAIDVSINVVGSCYKGNIDRSNA